MKNILSLALLTILSSYTIAEPSGLDYEAKAKALVSQMSLEEKALLLSGDGWWKTHKIERLHIPAMTVSDGPNGLRKTQGVGLAESLPATCFPTASALASSWNENLMQKVGTALGVEAQANDVQILLGPGINMKRSPLGGRNFEYFSEDPVLAGRLAASFINGVQGQGVGVSLKHFAANNQETDRMLTSSNVDERTLHEIYLAAFEIAVRESQPWSMMAAYNKVNGVYASENENLLQEILRKEWGFSGFVVSDWGAVNDRVKGVNSGLNLEMPGSGDYNKSKIIRAVKDQLISKETLDNVVTQLLTVILKSNDLHKDNITFDKEEHHAIAQEAASEGIVLLKNENHILPVSFQKNKKIAVIGAFAKNPRYQGAGSSHVNPTKISGFYDEFLKIIGKKSQVTYSQGYNSDGTTNDKLLREAQSAAQGADVALVFAGLPENYETEGTDRQSLNLPKGHNELISAIQKVQPHLVVVLINGSAITMPWLGKAKGVLEGWLSGQAGGAALAEIISGKINPSGRLSETFPVALEDTPTFLSFPSTNTQANYGEGVFIGYRYYDKKKVAPLFEFGFGLSYTNFSYSDLRLSSQTMNDSDTLEVQFKVKNTGPVFGKEVTQLYIHEQAPNVMRPKRELKSFSKIALKPGEEKIVKLTLKKRDFSYYDERIHGWVMNSGKFDIEVGSSSRDIRLHKTVVAKSDLKVYPPLTRESRLQDFRDNPKGQTYYSKFQNFLIGESIDDFLNKMPVNKFVSYTQGRFSDETLTKILKVVQEH